MARRTTQKYTAQQKRDAIQLANEIGASLAAVRLGIPKGTLSCWRFKDQAARKMGGAWPPFPAPAEEIDEVEQAPSATPLPAAKARRIAKVYTPSQRAVALELVAAIGVNAASRQLGISRYSLYEWRRKVEKAAQGKGDSPTSGPDPKDVGAKRDGEILAVWHEHPGLGPSQVRNQLRRKGIKVSLEARWWEKTCLTGGLSTVLRPDGGRGGAFSTRWRRRIVGLNRLIFKTLQMKIFGASLILKGIYTSLTMMVYLFLKRMV